MSTFRSLGLLLVACIPAVLGEQDAFNVTGRLLCNKDPFPGAEIVFYESDTTHFAGMDWNEDDYCYATVSDPNGWFTAAAYEDESSEADELYYIVRHTCRSEKPICSRFSLGANGWTRNSQRAPLARLAPLELLDAAVGVCDRWFNQAIKQRYQGPACARLTF
ncbi:hypothetical protein M3Y99_00910600 [Aphelenchoides fujianensis]|nr:hypothetical protein M3Y99_00910600 [Aphelenchoides fujianensis]